MPEQLTDTQINELIAGALNGQCECGHTVSEHAIDRPGSGGSTSCLALEFPSESGAYCSCPAFTADAPYATSADACREIIAEVERRGLWAEFSRTLWGECGKGGMASWYDGMRSALLATPRQICEAFLAVTEGK